MQCYGVIGTFAKGELRITSNDKEFLRIELIEGDGARLSAEVMQAMKNNEEIAATDASVKEEKMGGAWIIEDDYQINKHKGFIVSS